MQIAIQAKNGCSWVRMLRLGDESDTCVIKSIRLLQFYCSMFLKMRRCKRLPLKCLQMMEITFVALMILNLHFNILLLFVSLHF